MYAVRRNHRFPTQGIKRHCSAMTNLPISQGLNKWMDSLFIANNAQYSGRCHPYGIRFIIQRSDQRPDSRLTDFYQCIGSQFLPLGIFTLGSSLLYVALSSIAPFIMSALAVQLERIARQIWPYVMPVPPEEPTVLPRLRLYR